VIKGFRLVDMKVSHITVLVVIMLGIYNVLPFLLYGHMFNARLCP
jgi:hypothetical protein